jgi:anti-anti-sigma regulatory factor
MRHIETVVVRFSDTELCAPERIEEVGRELLAAVPPVAGQTLLLNFAVVKSISSAMIAKLVMLNKTCKAYSVRLKMCDVAPAIFDIFREAKLNKLFQIVGHVDDDPDAPDSVGCRLYVPDRPITRLITMKRIQLGDDAMGNEA